MAKFDLKKAILENKATFFSSLTEGQFSWFTQDTGQQIGSEEENTIPVYMFDVDTNITPKGYRFYWKHSPEGGRNGKLTSSVDIKSANYIRENIFNVNQAMMNNFSSSDNLVFQS